LDAYTAYGIPFPCTQERFDGFEDQLAVVTGLWSTPAGQQFAFDGDHYQLAESPALPKPAQTDGLRGGPPVLIGGLGKKRTPSLAATYADEFNLPFADVETTQAQFARVREACEAQQRDPATMRWSNALVVCVGADEAEVERRAQAIGREPAELRENGVAGTPQEAIDTIGRYAAAGAERIYLQFLDLADLDHLRLVAAEVMPHVG
jgi:alkanesulfonate monooxygenase SsuD/methylene tetrahydromethanopterin reductase-like flavin-dependent oxidoreductase (luciferase family)